MKMTSFQKDEKLINKANEQTAKLRFLITEVEKKIEEYSNLRDSAS